MSTIATLTSQESGSNSLIDINNNFSNLNTDKVESTSSTSVDSEVAIFSSTGGKTIKRASATGIAKLASGVLSAVTAPSGVIVGDTDSQTLTNKTLTTPTLTTPTIASFTNATHNHTNAAGGGTLAEAALVLTDITTNNASASKHGFLPKLSGVVTDVLKGDGTFGGVSTSVSPQKISIGSITNGKDNGCITAPYTGTDFTTAAPIWFSTANTTSAVIRQIVADSLTNQLYQQNEISAITGNNNSSVIMLCVLGSYLYASQNQSGTGSYKLDRYDVATGLNGVHMTISGTAPSNTSSTGMFTDGTFLFILSSAGSVNKYSISGTTATFVSTISYTSMLATQPLWSNGTSVYQTDGAGTNIYKWAIAGGARSTASSVDFSGLGGGVEFGLIGLTGGTKQARFISGTENTNHNYLMYAPITAI